VIVTAIDPVQMIRARGAVGTGWLDVPQQLKEG
jgi:hypothetical protein